MAIIKNDRAYEDEIRRAQTDNQYSLTSDDYFKLRGKTVGRNMVHTIGSRCRCDGFVGDINGQSYGRRT